MTIKQHEAVAVDQSGTLRVIIVGAGIAGLTLGIVLRQNGHHVQIYEQSRFGRELGAAVHMAPNAHGLFHKLGIDLAATGANEVQIIREYSPSGTLNREIDIQKVNKIWQHSWMLAHRVRIHEALKEKALAEDGPGRPCQLYLSSPVVSVDPQSATVTLKDESRVTGDAVVGADGVHSIMRRHVPGGEHTSLFGSGKSGFRFMIRREDALRDPATRKLCEQDGTFSVVIGTTKRIVMYPTSDNTLLNFLCIHPESESVAGDDWNTTGNKTTLLEVYKDFAPEFRAILAKAEPESLKLWKLWDMNDLPHWHHSRLVLIGDAAHPFLPHQGQGAAMAMEDAVALGTVLEKGLAIEQVPERLRLYNRIRHERASRIQQYTRLAGLDTQDNKLDTIEYAKYNFGHDEFDNSAQKLREWKWAQLPQVTFRTPVSFGPDPSLAAENPCSTDSARFRSTAVSFKTSRTVVQTFLPRGDVGLSITTPGTVATCSFVHTVFENVTWLRGGSYNTLGMYVHDVGYKGTNRGYFVPVMFGDLPHLVSRDREIYGLPALYTAIQTEHRAMSQQVTARFGELDWLEIKVQDLQPSAASTSAVLPDGAGKTGLLAWTCRRQFARDEQSNEKHVERDDFVVKVSFEKDEDAVRVEQIWETSNASIQFNLHDRASMPTLDHIVHRLAEMPIYQILGAKMIVGDGLPTYCRAQRLS